MREMVWNNDRYIDPKYGIAYATATSIMADKVNDIKIKIPLHPNITGDVGLGIQKHFRLRINAQPFDPGTSLEIWVANSYKNGCQPNPFDITNIIMPIEIFEEGEYISRSFPIIFNDDIEHCQWIITEIGNGKVDIDIQLDNWADFGDAPDNSLQPMSAGYDSPYENVQGKFPSLLATTNSTLPGNHHWDPYYIGLGADVSLEADAYAPSADEDIIPNIDIYNNASNQDSLCDALVDTFITAEQITQLTLVVKAYDSTTAYINILCDWNRDGTWGGNDPDNNAPEWVIKNQLVNLVPIYNDVITDSFLVSPTAGKTWMRINLSKFQITGQDWDGAGEFEYGEVEDYFIDVVKPTKVDYGTMNLPEKYSLSHSFPNPFNPVTKIRYALPKPGFVTLSVFNVLGQKIRTLDMCSKPAGHFEIDWNGKDDYDNMAASGTYFYQLQVEVNGQIQFNQTRKFLLAK